jgi:hypothetical protein
MMMSDSLLSVDPRFWCSLRLALGTATAHLRAAGMLEADLCAPNILRSGFSSVQEPGNGIVGHGIEDVHALPPVDNQPGVAQAH